MNSNKSMRKELKKIEDIWKKENKIMNGTIKTDEKSIQKERYIEGSKY